MWPTVLAVPHVIFYPLLAVGTYVSQMVFVIAFVVWIGISCGWIQRLIQWWVERELRRILNDTPVTIGSLQIHLWHGQVDVYNVILHTPRRQEWQWQSPLIARVGKVSIQASLSMWAYTFIQYGPRLVHLEIYTVRAEDIQVFVERQQHVFNFYLLDAFLELPDPSQIIQTPTPPLPDLTEVIHSHSEEGNAEDSTAVTSTPLTVTSVATTTASAALVAVDETVADVAIIAGSQTEDEDHQQKAQQLVNDMVLAVQSLGEAAQRGKITSALHQHRQSFASKLRQLTQQRNSVLLKESVQVMQQVSHAVVQNNKRGMGLLPFHPPAQRGDRQRPPPIHGRVGRVIVRNVRVFTRATSTSTISTTGGNTVTAEQPAVAVGSHDETMDDQQWNATSDLQQQQHSDDNDQEVEVIDEENTRSDSRHLTRPTMKKTSSRLTSKAPINNTTCWNRPLYIQQVVLRASDLCPPKSLAERVVGDSGNNGGNDDDDVEYPAIYQPLDKVAQVVLKRLLAEMAKSNTGRLLETAMGEVLAYLQVASTTNNNSSSTTATTTKHAAAAAATAATSSSALAASDHLTNTPSSTVLAASSAAIS